MILVAWYSTLGTSTIEQPQFTTVKEFLIHILFKVCAKPDEEVFFGY